MNKTTIRLVFVFLAAAPTLKELRAETLTYPDLVHRLTDLEHLATIPSAGENTGLASSYDRKSSYDAASDTYLNWDADDDAHGSVSVEGDKKVLADVEGPGCIWRIWAAHPQNGHVRIFLDGAEKPVLDLPFVGYFDSSQAPFNYPNLVYRVGPEGYNNYLPIPFAKSCKIVADAGYGLWYHFNYSRFAPGTVVPTFSPVLSPPDLAALDAANRKLGACGTDPAGKRAGENTEAVTVVVPAAGKARVLDLKGEGAITELRVNFNLPVDPGQQRKLLRELALTIRWDGEEHPSIWSPLGDFFADPIKPSTFASLPVSGGRDGEWSCFWYMPFATGARMEMQNASTAPIAMTWEIVHAPLDRPVASLLRFHAKWHRDAFLLKRKDRQIDWSLLKTSGKGRYVGTQLHVWNPKGDWWGEGDEKWFVDGEKFPSTFGTGSEDYFGNAYAWPGFFARPFHGQNLHEGSHFDDDDYRWHISDNVPFQKSFEGSIEKYFPNSRPTLYDAVAYWYLSPGGLDPYGEVPVSDRMDW